MRYTLLLGLALMGCTPKSSDDQNSDTDTEEEETGPLDGQGVITGDCGQLDAEELTASQSFFFSNTLEFQETFDETDLTEGGQEIVDDGNLGGSSIWSEVFAFEILYRCEGAILNKTEAEIEYVNADGKKTDLLVTIDNVPIGVSVTRAFGWPPEDPYTLEQATDLLTDKLGDIPISSANVSEQDSWDKQILHILAYTPDHADKVQQAWEALDPSITLDTVVVVTATEGEDAFMY